MTKQEAWIGVFRSAIARHNVNDRYQIDGKEVFLAGWAKFFADYAIEHMPGEEVKRLGAPYTYRHVCPVCSSGFY